ncbi:MAG: coenzyme F420-0:L-glutamate ligase [Patescibacteria group bacterium]|jgi:F420-0:gamma-glutamyl ligase
MKIKAIKTRIFKPSENLIEFIQKYLPKIEEETILVITSKIVALSEGRLVKKTSEKEKIKLIKSESNFCIPSKYAYLTIKNDVVMANAGVDESNAQDNIILLPKDSFSSAHKIRNYFVKKHYLKNFGVIITDSRSLPLRRGITGVSLGYAGFAGLKDYRHSLDIFGRPFKFSVVNVVDSLAVSAVLCMGEGDEKKPLAIITKAPVKYSDKIKRNELKIDIKDDMYGPIFRAKIK